MSSTVSLRRTTTAFVIGATCLLTIAACGGGSSSGTASKDNGIASKTPQDMLSAAKSAMPQQHTFHLAGSGTSGGEAFSVDLNVDVTHDSASGFLTNGAERIDIVRIGTQVYVKASADVYQSEGVPAAVASLLAGKWIKSTTANKDFAGFTDFTSLDGILTPDGALTKGTETTVNGKKVIGLVDAKGTKDEGTLYLQTTGDPLVVQEVPGAPDTGSINFDKYGASVDVSAPAGAVDFSQITGG